MRVLFLTDSLSLPRGEATEKVEFEETYINLLKTEYDQHIFAESAIGGATIMDLYKQIFYYKHFNPDLVILHCGIVDCAPRAWRKLGRKILGVFGFKLKGLTRFMRKHRGLRLTSPKKFRFISEKIKNEFQGVPIHAIGILPASDEYEKKVPGIKKSILLYNSILAEKFDLISNEDFPFEAILSDHHHLNKKGHLLIKEKLMDILG